MKNTLAISAIVLTIGTLSLPTVWSDNDFRWNKNNNLIVKNPLYNEECGSCHMAYPPSLLPARSWTHIMHGLENHFEDNAELDSETAQLINQYLLSNSSDKSDYRKSKKFNRSINPSDIPMRISELPYFKHEHDEISQRMVSGNPQVKSFSQCNACHIKAEQGNFNEHEVNIPGYGYWDD